MCEQYLLFPNEETYFVAVNGDEKLIEIYRAELAELNRLKIVLQVKSEINSILKQYLAQNFRGIMIHKINSK